MFRKIPIILAVLVLGSVGAWHFLHKDTFVLPWSAPATCDYDGTTYKVGEARPAEDSCNACSCGPTGWSCTDFRCPKTDGLTMGKIKGELVSAEALPALRVCADAYMVLRTFCVQTNAGATSYELVVPQGTYWVRAAKLSEPEIPIAWHTAACDGSACLDHSPFRLTIEGGGETRGDIHDWKSPISVGEMAITPSKRIDSGHYYLENPIINIETKGAASVGLVGVPYLTWLANRNDSASFDVGKAELMSEDKGVQTWRMPVPEGLDVGRLWAVATSADGAIFASPGLGWVRTDDVNWPEGKTSSASSTTSATTTN